MGDDLPKPKVTTVKLRDLEREAIIEALREFGWRRDLAAAALGIAYRTMTNRIREYKKSGMIIGLPATPRKRRKKFSV